MILRAIATGLAGHAAGQAERNQRRAGSIRDPPGLPLAFGGAGTAGALASPPIATSQRRLLHTFCDRSSFLTAANKALTNNNESVRKGVMISGLTGKRFSYA